MEIEKFAEILGIQGLKISIWKKYSISVQKAYCPLYTDAGIM